MWQHTFSITHSFVTLSIDSVCFNIVIDFLATVTCEPEHELVNAHLTPGPGIYFNACIHVYSPGQGQTTPWGQMLMSTESPYHFAHLL